MHSQERARARAAISALQLHGANSEVAEHWLSLWRLGKPPSMRRHYDSPAPHRAATMLCRIRKDESLFCVKAGALVRVALGFEIGKQNLLAITAGGERDARLAYWWELTEGAVSVTYRRFSSRNGASRLVQGVALPLSQEESDGARHFLMHTNWRPAGDDWIEGNVNVEYQTNCERRLVSFRTDNAAA